MNDRGWFARYSEAQRRRALAMMTNPLWIGMMMALTWIFFRWWPAILFTVWFAFCVVSAFRIRGRENRHSPDVR